MYNVYFYEDSSGNQPLLEYLLELSGKNDKDSRIKFGKINDYIEALARYGLELREPFIKHLEGEIWELRPIRDRILFAAWDGESFILLH